MFRFTAIVVLVTLAWPQREDEEAAVAAVLSVGGTVTRDNNLPGKPVVKVELTACSISPAGFEKLRFLKRLQHLDL